VPGLQGADLLDQAQGEADAGQPGRDESFQQLPEGSGVPEEGEMKKKQDAYRTLNDGFSEALGSEFKEKFGIKVETVWSIVDFGITTTRLDGKPFTQTEHDWIGAFEIGYRSAMKVVGGL
jgi:hypothetical protein